MILKLWNGVGNCWVFWDNVKKVQVENDWAFLSLGKDLLNNIPDADGPYHLYRDDDGVLRMNTSIIQPYAADYRSDKARMLINESSVNDSFYTVRIVNVVFRNNDGESFILEGAGMHDAFLMNDEGRTIDRL